MSEEDLCLQAFTEFLNAVEAGIAAARQQIKAVKVGWDPAKIKWTDAEGSKGPYQRSEDLNNLEFKAILKDLASHNGTITRNGYFYWIFQNGSTVGRKKRGKQESQPAEILEKIEKLFPEDLRGLLSFKQETGTWIIKPRQFLGADNFSKILAIVKGHGGKYVSAGKESRFEVPKKTAR